MLYAHYASFITLKNKCNHAQIVWRFREGKVQDAKLATYCNYLKRKKPHK